MGFSKYFRKASDEEREHGMKLMDYQVSYTSLAAAQLPVRSQANHEGSRWSGAERSYSRTSPNLQPWSGAQLWRPCRPPWSLRRRWTLFFYTVYAFLFLTGKSESARPSQGWPGRQWRSFLWLLGDWISRRASGRYKGDLRPHHQDDQSRRWSWTSYHRQRVGSLSFVYKYKLCRRLSP